MFGFALFFGTFAFPLYARCAADVNDSVEEGGFVEASSGLLMLYAAGAVVGPLVASATTALVGPNGLFVYTSVVHAAMALFAVHRMRQHARPDADEHSRLQTRRVSRRPSPCSTHWASRPRSREPRRRSAGSEDRGRRVAPVLRPPPPIDRPKGQDEPPGNLRRLYASMGREPLACPSTTSTRCSDPLSDSGTSALSGSRAPSELTRNTPRPTGAGFSTMIW